MKTVELLCSPTIVLLEERILDLHYKMKAKDYTYKYEEYKTAISQLFELRKEYLDRVFEMDDKNKQLLYDFNEALRKKLIEMRKRVIETYEGVAMSNRNADVHAVGRCFLGYKYPDLHPIQNSPRTVQIWELLNGSIDNFDSQYRDGVLPGGYRYDKHNHDSELQMLYLCDELTSWDEGLELEPTDEVFLTFGFHHLYEHTHFSVYDLLPVREFNVEIIVEIDY